MAVNNCTKDFMKTHLNDVTCYVKSGGLQVEKDIEGRVHLIFQNNYGLCIYSSLEFNSVNISDTIFKLTEDRELISYEVLDYLRGEFITKLKQTEVQLGRIYPHNVIKIDMDLENGKLHSCKLIFIDGSICELSNIEPCKKN